MMLRQEREQIEFARRKRDLPRSAQDATRLHIKRKVTNLLSQWICGIGSAQQRTNPREQLGECERFY
jgi:hypothetical protein